MIAQDNAAVLPLAICTFLTTAIAMVTHTRGKQHVYTNASAVALHDADDDCNSLFYNVISDPEILTSGQGIPTTHTLMQNEIDTLKFIHPDYKRFDKSFYTQCVKNLPIVCVDVMLQRKSDQKLLLFYRRDKPAANTWWWPGGRMFRGETFYDAAIRKITEETGHNKRIQLHSHSGNRVDHKDIECVGVVGVWNTLFPDSSFDVEITQNTTSNESQPQLQTTMNNDVSKNGTQTVNIVVVCKLHDSHDLQYCPDSLQAYAVAGVRWVSIQDMLRKNHGSDGCIYDKYVRLNAQKALHLGLLDI